MPKRACADCYSVRLSKVCNGLGQNIEGFQAKIEKSYQIQLDEKEEPYVTDLKGERIKSTKRAGEFKSLTEVLEEEGMAAKVYAAANNKGPAPINRPTPINQPAPTTPGATEPFVHPSARAAAGQ